MDFNAKFHETSQCISMNLIEPCLDCLSAYQTLNTFYDGIREIKGDKFCFDTQDKVKLFNVRHIRFSSPHLFAFIFQMNKTRILWSNQLHCCGHRDTSKLIFFALASAAITIIIGFYMGLIIFEKRVERRHVLIPNDSHIESANAQNDLNKPSTSNEAIKRGNRSRISVSESSDDMNDDDDGPIHNPNLVNI